MLFNKVRILGEIPPLHAYTYCDFSPCSPVPGASVCRSAGGAGPELPVPAAGMVQDSLLRT